LTLGLISSVKGALCSARISRYFKSRVPDGYWNGYPFQCLLYVDDIRLFLVETKDSIMYKYIC